ncbi:PREDICTED: protein FAR1-RELATED SEQUENCE 5-like isoform X2 [Nelumbo nucifera]|uniref:Protein FAR1-RELATED SEQUENCE 5-like isoform X2 n=1 Tax=Nelumbo nucifera TaxID=4432 RepID=A0A1U8AXT7_NELNU|nr:PREDICTED: protein FAR1-RELATED SEQUENCE 5-like isoform X2 [Nelumbo nucifera]
MDGKHGVVEGTEIMESSNGKELAVCEDEIIEPYVGMEFESEEAAKVFYDAYATHLGFVMRVDAFRRSLRDGKVICRRLVCNKEGFRRNRPRRSESRKPRAITREGCKAMIMVKREKTGKWVVSRFVKEHNHPLVISSSGNSRRSLLLSQTPIKVLVRLEEENRTCELCKLEQPSSIAVALAP